MKDYFCHRILIKKAITLINGINATYLSIIYRKIDFLEYNFSKSSKTVIIYHEVQFPKKIGTGCKKQQTATSDTTHPKSCSFANWGIEDAKLRNRLRGENVTIPTLQGGEKGEAATMCIYM